MDDVLKGKWNQLKGEIKNQWGKLTDDDLTQIEGDQDKLIGKVQELYGTSKDEVSRKLHDIVQQKSENR
jgi:uncharacterized protein YjbJ (UPF0337 family)